MARDPFNSQLAGGTVGIVVKNNGHIRILCLDWPESRNSLGPEEGQELFDALHQISQDEDCHAVVLSSTGPAFCAGGNLKSIAQISQHGPEAVRTAVYSVFQTLFQRIEDFPVPLLAAVDGAAIGVGADLALAADVTFIGAGGYLKQGWMALGAVPATGGTEYVRRRGGRSAVWRFLTADRVDGAAAQEMGLGLAVSNGCAAAMAMADTLGKMPREQIIAVRRLSRIEDIRTHWKVALDYQSDFLSRQSFIDKAAEILGTRRK